MRALSLILGFLTSRLFVTFLGVLALSLVIWFLGPKITISGDQPLESVAARVTAISGLLLIWLLLEILRRWRLRRLNRKMIESLAESRSLSSLAETQTDEEAEIIRQRFEHALEVLQQRTVSGRSGGRYLYDLPWYVLIGPPGAGKTTVLENSGLRFPLADELGVEMIEGFGGTRTCDWWFTEDAVFIDTAGRYTTQNINPESDKAAWRSFLDILKTHRARRPVNGIIVSLDAAALLGNGEDITTAGDAIKARIQELMGTFRTRLPIYVLITKADLVAGFAEYFSDLHGDDRDQVLGLTLAVDRAGTSAKALEDFSQQYDRLVRRLSDRLLGRLDEEYRTERRRRMFGFPQQMAGLKRPLEKFLTDVFRPSRYSTQPLLRGVYLTSGTQGGVPVDGLMRAHSEIYGLDPAPVRPQDGAGHSYFVKQILEQIVVPEQHLAGADVRVERRLLFYHLGGYALVALVSAGLVTAWYYAERNAAPIIANLQDQLDQFEQARDAYRRSPNLDAAVQAVIALDPEIDNEDLYPPIGALFQSAGLLASASVRPRVEKAFDEAADDILLPAVVTSVGKGLRDLVQNSRDSEQLRSLLEIYLGFKYDQFFKRNRLNVWAQQQAQRLYPLEPKRQELAVEAFGHAFDHTTDYNTIDESLVDLARQRLFSVPPAEQVYTQLKQQSYLAGLPTVSMQTILGLRDSQYFVHRRDQGERAPNIPSLYSASGFYTVFLRQVPDLISQNERADPLLGVKNSNQNEETKKIIDQVSKVYAQDYVDTWNTFLDGITIRPLRNVQDANNVLEQLASTDSPLVRMLNAVAQNTLLPLSRMSDPSAPVTGSQSSGGGPLASLTSALSGGGGAAGQAASAASGAAGGGSSTASQSAANSAAQAALAQIGPFSNWPGTAISEPFHSLHDMVLPEGGNQPGITAVEQELVNVYSAVNLVATAPDVGKAAFDEVSNRIKNPRQSPITQLTTAAVNQPSPIREILSDLSRETWGVLLDSAEGYLNTQWQQNVSQACQNAIMNRYPVYPKAKVDTTLTDFGNFFSPSGTMQTFFNTYLAPFVDTSTSPWKLQTIDGKGLNIAPATLQAFEDAATISKAFFSDGTPSPSVSFTLRPDFLDAQAAKIAFNVDGDIFTYQHEPPRDLALTWPGKDGIDQLTITMTDLNGVSTSYSVSGPWAWFHTFDNFGLTKSSLPDQYTLDIKLKDLEAKFDLKAKSVANPFDLPALTDFRCLGQL